MAASLYELIRNQNCINGVVTRKGVPDTIAYIVLAYPVLGEKFILESDASRCGIGGVLFQVINGTEIVVGYYSRTL